MACLPAQHLAAQDTPASRELGEEIGSLRNARVAIPMPEEKIELTYFAGPLSEEAKQELARVAPNVRIISGLSPAEALERAGEAHGVDGRYATGEFLSRAKNLVWVHTMTAGVDRYLAIEPLVKNDALVLTNSRGVHGPTIADHAMAMLLYLTRNLRVDAANEARRGAAAAEEALKPTALDGKTMLVVGVGGIGSEIGKRAHGFGMRVLGTRRSKAPSPEFFEHVGLSEDLFKLLPEADVVAIAVPLTDETRGLFDAKAFAAMKPGAHLINIARGQIVDTDALLEALHSGRLAGAGLDVTDPEPLPADHPLRKLPNVVITPHVAGVSEVTSERSNALLTENIRRFGAGEPLLNVVDKQAGY